MTKFLSSLFLLFASSMVFGQFDINDPLENCELNNDLIKQYNIRSLTVYADIDERRIDGTSTMSGKIKEYEFDQNGNVVYQLSAKNGGNGPFIYYDKGSRPQYFTYDANGNVTYHSREDYRTMSETSYIYNEAGNNTQTEFVFKDQHQDVRFTKKFEWVDGKIVGCTNDTENGTLNNGTQTFDDEGRIVESKNDYSRMTYSYTQDGDTLKTTEKMFINGDLHFIKIHHTLSWLPNRYVYYSKRNSIGKLELIMRASYDDQGNTTSFYLIDYKNSYEAGVGLNLDPLELRIENRYDSRGLLYKQLYYSIDSSNSEESLTQMIYYCYETEPLNYKMEKGAVSRNSLEKEPLRDY